MTDHFFKGLVKELNDENTNLADSGANSSEYSGCIDSGSYILNAALTGSLYGGVPNNKITALRVKARQGKLSLFWALFAISCTAIPMLGFSISSYFNL